MNFKFSKMMRLNGENVKYLINHIKDLNKELNDMPTSRGKFKIAVSMSLLISILRANLHMLANSLRTIMNNTNRGVITS